MSDDRLFTNPFRRRAAGKNGNGAGNGSGNGSGADSRTPPTLSAPGEAGAKQIYVSGAPTGSARGPDQSAAPSAPPREARSPQPSSQTAPRSSPAGERTPQSSGDLADHFLGCAKLGRYLTVSDNSRFIITDDFRTTPIVSAASAMAAIYSKDDLVAQAALLPLSERAQRLSSQDRERYERLFVLIEEQALSGDVRSSAQTVRQAQFRAAEIRAIEAELGDRLSPARLRYRQFLSVVNKLMDRKITAGPFLDEFRGFTQEVAGKLDFGIYSFCLDRLFGSVRVPLKVKKLLALELLKYPPLIRRELLTNILVYPGQAQELIDFIRYMVANELGQGSIIEIELLEAFKLRRLSMGDIESSLARAGAA